MASPKNEGNNGSRQIQGSSYYHRMSSPRSSQSFASYTSCGSRTACLDFTPIPADDDRFQKCESFWRFVQSSPALELIKTTPATQKVREESVDQVEDEVQEEFQSPCLLKLNDISKRGITKTVLNLPLPGHGCSSGNLTDLFAEPEAAAAQINAKLKSWDRAHTCWSIPPSTKYTVQAATMPTP